MSFTAMMFAVRPIAFVLLVASLLPLTTIPGQEKSAAARDGASALPFDFAAELQALNAGWRAELDGGDFGERQRKLMERAVQTDPQTAVRTFLDRPELVMVGDFWLINVQAFFRLWGKTDLPAMAEWVKSHPLDPKLQPAADYALFQHRVGGLAEAEVLSLWRNQPAATRHWAKRDVSSIVASSDPGTALERIARLFPGGDRGEMMSLAMDVVARKHPRTLLPWLADLAPFFYNEPSAWEALLRLPAAEVEAALLGLTEKARAEILLEYMRACLSRDEPERVRKLISGVTVEPYKSLIEKEWNAAMDKPQPPQD